MDVRTLAERTQMIDMFWNREVKKLLSLKPSAVIQKDEIVNIAEQIQQGRGVSSFDVTSLWQKWTGLYNNLIETADETKEHSKEELLEIYGVTKPISKGVE